MLYLVTMRKAPVWIVAVAFISIFSTQIAFAAITPGTKCSKLGVTASSGGKKYTCVKSGKKLVWNKGVAIPKPTPSPTASVMPTPIAIPTPTASATPTPTPTVTARDWIKSRSTDLGFLTEFSGPCQKENDLPAFFSAVQDAFMTHRNCSGIYRIAKYDLGQERPKSTLTSNLNDLPTKRCEISEPTNSMNIRGFFNLFEPGRLAYTNSTKIPGPKMTVQIIPIYASDTAKPSNSPEVDYGAYTEFLADWAKYSSDGESSIEIRFPKNYIEFSGKVTSYNINHENRHDSPDHKRFVKDLVAVVDPQINFTGADTVIVVVPPGTPLASFQQGTLKDFATQEGLIRVGTTEYPYTLTDMSSVKFANFTVPFWWIHELYHSGLGLDDHYGDTKNDVSTEYGLGWWTMMTPFGGDLSAWEKWFIGFITDSQVHCLSVTEPTVRWIVPSSVKSKEKKLIVIPISQHKGIVIESIRAAGLYYKIPAASQGALVYVVDLQVVGHGLGLKLVLPTNRNPNQPPFFLSQATLREGESVISNGYKITIIESGNFGDVIKVEKA